MKKTRIYITMLCVILTMLVIFILPAVADEVILDGSNNIYGDDYKPVETDVVYESETDFVDENETDFVDENETDFVDGNETDFEGGKDTEWSGVETDVVPEETEEIVHIVMDNMNKIYNNNMTYMLRVSASGAPTSSFVMELGLPWFVTVKDVQINDELMMVENAIYEKSFNENHLSISYSSPVNFAETDLFYIEYMINATGDHSDSSWVNFAQFVNDDAVEVEYTFEGGIFNISDKKMIKGDVNLDGYVALEDVMYVLRYLVGYDMNFSEMQYNVADIDKDGIITIIDCQYIQNYIVGKIGSLDDVKVCEHVYDDSGKCIHCGDRDINNEGGTDEGTDVPSDTCSHKKYLKTILREPTCINVGHAQYTCHECGYSWKEIIEPNGNHNYDETGVCIDCGDANVESGDEPEVTECEHLKAEVVKSSEPTCVSEGFLQYKCSECGYMWEEVIAPNGNHVYDENGFCTYCGEGTDIPEAPDCEHLNATVVKSSEPTCVREGFSQYKCSECGYMWKEVIAPNGKHVYDENGVCIDCGEGTDIPEVPDIPEASECEHLKAEVVKSSEPTCVSEGFSLYKCSECGYMWEEVIEPNGNHVYDENGVCTYCGEGVVNPEAPNCNGLHISDGNGTCINCGASIIE